jgi:signal transduction histidine kinase
VNAFFRSMSGRVFLILLLGILAAASLTYWLAFGERQRTMVQFRDARLVEQAEQFIITLDAIPAAGRHAFLATSRRFGLQADLLVSAAPARVGPAPFGDSNLKNALSQRLGADYRVRELSPPSPECNTPRARRVDSLSLSLMPPMPDCESIAVTLRDGSLIRLMALPPRNPMPPPRTELLPTLALFLLSIALLAFIVARMTMRPLKQLAQAARDLGNDIDHPPLVPQGATEIRQATAAFNAMQARIRTQVQQRTHMLAAITHDLQTPLTRLRLRLEKVDNDSLREKLIEDLSATQSMVREGLELARSIDASEPLQPLNLDSLLDSVCADAGEAGQAVTLEGAPHMSVMARPSSLRRCLTNLIDNAVKYGGKAAVTVQRCEHAGKPVARITVTDGGPGIDESLLQKVFEPFFRIETSRSRQTGGTGLGLTIARNIAQQHGGSLTLVNLADGAGLQAVLLLPEKPRTGSPTASV